jgi:O-methyltransferase
VKCFSATSSIFSGLAKEADAPIFSCFDYDDSEGLSALKGARQKAWNFEEYRLSHFSNDGASFFRLQELEAQREELLTSISEITVQRDSLVKTVTQMIEQRDAAYNTIAEMSQQRAVITAEYETLAGQYGKLTGQYELLSGQYGKLTGQYELLSGQYGKLTGQYETLSGQYCKLTGHYEKLTEQYNQLSEQRDLLHNEHHSVVQQRDNLIKQIAEMSLGFSVNSKIKSKKTSTADEPGKPYLDLMEKVLTGLVYDDPPLLVHDKKEFSAEDRLRGLDWPANAFSMVGVARMRNFRSLLERVLAEDVPGDIVETGVWRGGASIMAKAVLHAHGDTRRRVFLADSFEGLPPPNGVAFPADEGSTFHEYKELAVSEEQVKENFRRLGLLDERVITVRGWFRDTMPTFPVSQIAILRLDGDMYESTIDPLNALYDKISRNGWIIVDDYLWIDACKRAVHDFLDGRGLKAEITHIDGVGVFFQKV